MYYPIHLTAPMNQELTDAGFESLQTPEAVSAVLENPKGTVLLVVNSVCGCAARNARPAAIYTVQNSGKLPDKIVTVFAGVDLAATQKARDYMLPYPPSSPSMALFKDGNLVHFIERHHIEGRNAASIAANLKMALEEYC
jgi:putative YphP/YqiW family bacilliredoxin